MNAELPLVSVIMPSFNQAQFIEASIASVLEQSWSRLELVVVDGGSSDGSVELLRAGAARDARLRYVSEPDRGPADALNKALSRVRGTVIGWLNSDDLYTPGAIDSALAEFARRPDLLMVYGRAEHVDARGCHLSVYPTLPPTTPLRRFAEGCFICQPSMLFRRTVPLMLGAFDVKLKTAFDFDYWLRAFAAFPGRIGFVERIQAQSRLHDACITQRMRRQVALDGAEVLRRHLGRAPVAWILTHMEEARRAGEPGLEAYLSALVDDARDFYTDAECQALRLAAADIMNQLAAPAD